MVTFLKTCMSASHTPMRFLGYVLFIPVLGLLGYLVYVAHLAVSLRKCRYVQGNPSVGMATYL